MANPYDSSSYAGYQVQLPSFQDLLITPQYLTEQHNLLDEELALESNNISNVNSLLKEGLDDDVIAITNQVNNQINSAAEQLASTGYSRSGGRRNLIGVRRAYNEQITPIQNIAQLRQLRSDEVRQAALKDPSLIYNDPSNISVSEGLRNPNVFDTRAISGVELTRQVAQQAQAFKNQIQQEKPELVNSGLAFQYFTRYDSGASIPEIQSALVREGYNPEDVSEITRGLRSIVDNTLQANGVYDLFGNDESKINQAFDYASQGLYSAAGTTQFGNMTDNYGLQLALERQREARTRVKETKQDSFQQQLLRNVGMIMPNKELLSRLNEIQERFKNLDNNNYLGKSRDKVVNALVGVNTVPYSDEQLEELWNSYMYSGGKTGLFGKAGGIRSDINKLSPDAREREKQKFFNDVNNLVDDNAELFTTLGIDANTLTTSEIGDIIEDIKNKGFQYQRFDVLDSATDNQAIDALGQRLANIANLGNIITNPNGKPTDEWFLSEAYDADKGKFKPGYSVVTTAKGLGIMDPDRRIYDINLTNFDSGFIREQEKLDFANLRSNDPEYKQIFAEEVYNLKQLIQDGAISEDVIKQYTQTNNIDEAILRYVNSNIQQLQSRYFDEAQRTIKASLSSRNTPINMNPNSKAN